MARLVHFFGFTALALSLAACGSAPTKTEDASNKDKYDNEGGGLNIARLIGTSKNPPDEFAVISNKPLEMPRDFAALPPPNPGERSRLRPDPVSEARAALFTESATAQPANVRTSVSETALLDAAGASDPTIRATLAADDADYQDEQNLYVLDRVFPALRALRGEDNKNLVDPLEERVRLNEVAGGARARAARGDAIAVIPGTPQAQPTLVQPAAPTQPSVAPALPSSGAVAPAEAGGLIYIPE